MPKSKREYGLGRIVTIDTRDKTYPLRKILPLKSDRTERYWDSAIFLDQGSTPTCVGHSWAHWTNDPPIIHPQTIDPFWIYDEAQKIDGIPFPHDGTTVRAGAKVLQRIGVITNYYWAASVDEIVLALLELGPITVGTDWYSGMMGTDSKDVIHISGSVVGGHAWLLNGVNTITGMLRLKNSWGRSWAGDGLAFISIADFARLFTALAEGCMATEVPVPIEPTPGPEPACPLSRAVSKIPGIGWPLVRGYRKARKKLFGIEPGVP